MGVFCCPLFGVNATRHVLRELLRIDISDMFVSQKLAML